MPLWEMTACGGGASLMERMSLLTQTQKQELLNGPKLAKIDSKNHLTIVYPNYISLHQLEK